MRAGQDWTLWSPQNSGLSPTGGVESLMHPVTNPLSLCPGWYPVTHLDCKNHRLRDRLVRKHGVFPADSTESEGHRPSWASSYSILHLLRLRREARHLSSGLRGALQGSRTSLSWLPCGAGPLSWQLQPRLRSQIDLSSGTYPLSSSVS